MAKGDKKQKPFITDASKSKDPYLRAIVKSATKKQQQVHQIYAAMHRQIGIKV